MDVFTWCYGFKVLLYLLVDGLALALTVMIAQHSRDATDTTCRMFSVSVVCPFAEVAGIVTVPIISFLAASTLLVLMRCFRWTPSESRVALLDLVGHVFMIPPWFSLCVMTSATSVGLAFCSASVSDTCLRARALIALSWTILGTLLLSALLGVLVDVRKRRPVTHDANDARRPVATRDPCSRRPMEPERLESDTQFAKPNMAGVRVLVVQTVERLDSSTPFANV
ncbi:hypothetical protein F1559_000720 [Cyanidiococcus yangmingshanensis]|uniref:Transmembrane protein n=1 Tax=Cyanidiococcus yangmingshanensis TaxID=2690220 RepID=A0A7J7IG83_9RHOD|nr:hypothetical protein F1559_000720 [Cyanidiococcus yangmingshanensis]